jgi:hypothetical protein
LFLGLVWYEKRYGPARYYAIWKVTLVVGGCAIVSATRAEKPPGEAWTVAIALGVGVVFVLLEKVMNILTRMANRRIERFHASQGQPTNTNP